MLPTVKGPAERFLTDVNRVELSLEDVQNRLSSGIRVGRPSDDPAVIAEILKTFSEIAASKQTLSNLGVAKAELQTADSALSQAVKAIEQAITVGTEAASTLSNSQRNILADQVRTIQELLISVSNTQSGGRYLFSGDLDQQPEYELDAAQPNGVRQLTTAASTRSIVDSSGVKLWTAPTAQELFDNPSGNAFQAVNDLLAALQSGSTVEAAAAVDALKNAGEHLNQQLGLLGIAQNRVDDAETVASRHSISQQQSLSTLRDGDTVADASALTQLDIQHQAALNARAKISQLGLFDFLG